MVSDNSFTRRRNDDRQPDDTPDRGQVILIGAITLAFIILGVVVIFNGVLYTETLSSADTGQSASAAEKTELEVTQGVGCLIAEHNDEDIDGEEPVVNGEELERDIESFNKVYQNATAHSRPAVVNLVIEDDLSSLPLHQIIDNGVTVTITYDSNDISYEQERTIDASDCPGGS